MNNHFRLTNTIENIWNLPSSPTLFNTFSVCIYIYLFCNSDTAFLAITPRQKQYHQLGYLNQAILIIYKLSNESILARGGTAKITGGYVSHLLRVPPKRGEEALRDPD